MMLELPGCRLARGFAAGAKPARGGPRRPAATPGAILDRPGAAGFSDRKPRAELYRLPPEGLSRASVADPNPLQVAQLLHDKRGRLVRHPVLDCSIARLLVAGCSRGCHQLLQRGLPPAALLFLQRHSREQALERAGCDIVACCVQSAELAQPEHFNQQEGEVLFAKGKLKPAALKKYDDKRVAQRHQVKTLFSWQQLSATFESNSHLLFATSSALMMKQLSRLSKRNFRRQRKGEKPSATLHFPRKLVHRWAAPAPLGSACNACARCACRQSLSAVSRWPSPCMYCTSLAAHSGGKACSAPGFLLRTHSDP